jgi:hypothetical protein
MSLKERILTGLFFIIIAHVFTNIVRLEDLVFSKQTQHVLAAMFVHCEQALLNGRNGNSALTNAWSEYVCGWHPPVRGGGKQLP